jgi:phytanoyl-CoA dioxygenase PhyH
MANVLRSEQLGRYERDGILFPLPALAPAEAARFRAALQELRDRLGGNPKPSRMSQPQLHFRWAYDLATHPAVLDAVEDVLGPDVLVHSASVFWKGARDPGFVSWHQDGHYWDLSEARLVSAWVALSPSNRANGCLRVIPGSHHGRLPHNEAPGAENNLLASGLEVAVEVDESEALDVVLAPGEMSLHHLNLVHGSEPNRSDTDRVGFAIRYATPGVRQAIPHHAVLLARGRDEHHHFDHLASPPDDGLEAGLASLEEFLRRPSRRT